MQKSCKDRIIQQYTHTRTNSGTWGRCKRVTNEVTSNESAEHRLRTGNENEQAMNYETHFQLAMAARSERNRGTKNVSSVVAQRAMFDSFAL